VTPIIRLGIAAVLANLLTLLLAVALASAAQVEVVADGGFEGTTCGATKTSCTNANWPLKGSEATVCKTPPCEAGAASGNGFFRFGGKGGTGDPEYSEVSQSVTIPAAPATLSFDVVYADDGFDTVNYLKVFLDGVELKEITSAPSYTHELIDVSASAGGGPKTLTFEFLCGGEGGARCPVVDLDDVSLLSGTPTPANPTTPPSGGPAGGGTSPLPNTKLISHPRPKTPSHEARFEFESTDRDASFECSLDGGRFKVCVSPRILHVGRGLHIFKVRAVSSGVDKTPASFEWRVVRPHRHHHHR
jgi:hypothetical protein